MSFVEESCCKEHCMCRMATLKDIPHLTEMFWNHLLINPDYISHGEIQMGVATGVGMVAPKGDRKWKEYITEKITDSRGQVFIHEENQEIAGFVVLEISDDGDKPFGVICDIIVNPAIRGKGIGSRLLDAGIGWLSEQGITDFYLESGKDNHQAHAFFEHRGFSVISHIFKLKSNIPAKPKVKNEK